MQTISMWTKTINSLIEKMAISITLCKVQTFLKGHKNLKHLPLYLTLYKKTPIKWKIASNFVDFLEKLNFNTHWFDAKLILSIQRKIISGSGGGPQGLCGYFVLQNKHGFECNRLKKRVKKTSFQE